MPFFVIHGPPVSYKRKRIGRHRALPSDVRDWRDSAIVQLRSQWKLPPIESSVYVEIHVFLGFRQNMDAISAAEGALDVLQVKCGRAIGPGIIRNDKQAKDVRILEKRDRDNPRIEIHLRAID